MAHRIAKQALVLIAFAAALFALAVPAGAATPFADPVEILRLTFEPSSEPLTDVKAIPIGGEAEPVAIWGPTNAVSNGGSWSLWCAGVTHPSGVATAYAQYPETTRGEALKDLPQLVDFYGARFSFHYLMPSLAGADAQAFRIYWSQIGTGGQEVGNRDVNGVSTLSSTWRQSPVYDLSSPTADANLSRRAGRIVFFFFDRVETYQSPTTGVGPSIDDVVVSGYKYGAVRAIAPSYLEGAGVTLSWSAPASSTTDPADDNRSMAYRVWRSLAGYGDWTEVTGARTTSKSFTDGTAQEGFIYDYLVQAWEPGTGAHHRPQSTPVTFVVPGTRPEAERVDPPNVGAGIVAGRSFAATGVVEPQHPAGGPVATIEASRDKLSVEATFAGVSSNVIGGSLYTAAVTLPAKGVWHLRAVHDDGDHSVTASEWVTVTVAAQQPAFALTSSRWITLKTYGASHTITGVLRSEGASLAGQPVVLQYASHPDDPFKPTSLSATTTANGEFSFTVAPRSRAYYRVAYAGDGSLYEGATSLYVRVAPVPSVGVPRAPSTMYAGRFSSVYGYLKPRHESGTRPVRIYKYRYVSGSWKSYGYVTAKAANYSSYTKYTASVKLSYRGRWRLRAYHPDDGAHAKAWSSSYDYVTVK